MALSIYEVVARDLGEVWTALVAAHGPAEARNIACINQPRMIEIRSCVIHYRGADKRENSTPGILRGPSQEYRVHGS